MSKNEEIEFKYIFDDEYRPVYANGVYGGPNPHGELVLNFFTERWAIPKKELVNIDESGKSCGDKLTEPQKLPVVRTISCGVIINKETASQIYDWLGRILGR